MWGPEPLLEVTVLWRVQSDTIGFYEYAFLLVINCTRGRIFFIIITEIFRVA